MLTCDLLGFLIMQAYPDLKRGIDFWVCHPVDSKTLEQTGPAIIAGWQNDHPQPILDDIEKWWAQYGPKCIELDAERVAKNRLPYLIDEADDLVEHCLDLEAIAPDRATRDSAAQTEHAARAYRQALRDVPKQPGYPLNIDWPVKPADPGE
ncbi:phage tail assembly chaperone [Paraburkholderia sp. BR14263]|uniref:XkdW family protein n=1 Tax=unclassified Paraburkholderia TaxID=2615204 RepID=UPI0034CF94CD